jgi:hypothetical protein
MPKSKKSSCKRTHYLQRPQKTKIVCIPLERRIALSERYSFTVRMDAHNRWMKAILDKVVPQPSRKIDFYFIFDTTNRSRETEESKKCPDKTHRSGGLTLAYFPKELLTDGIGYRIASVCITFNLIQLCKL